jgi:hypothetical protein
MLCPSVFPDHRMALRQWLKLYGYPTRPCALPATSDWSRAPRPIESPQSNGMATPSCEPSSAIISASVRSQKPATVLRQLPFWFEHNNTVHPHRALGYPSSRDVTQGIWIKIMITLTLYDSFTHHLAGRELSPTHPGYVPPIDHKITDPILDEKLSTDLCSIALAHDGTISRKSNTRTQHNKYYDGGASTEYILMFIASFGGIAGFIAFLNDVLDLLLKWKELRETRGIEIKINGVTIYVKNAKDIKRAMQIANALNTTREKK